MRNAIAVLAALLVWSGVARAADVAIGVTGPMTGANAAFGTQFRNGAQQAVADINAAGGVLGRHVSLVVGDDACDPKQAVSVANDMADRGVVFVAGHFCSSSSIPASHVYADEGILEISPGSTNPAYTDSGLWNTFRVCGRDDQQGKVAGDYIASHFKDAKVAVLDDNTAYGKGLAADTLRNMRAHGKQATMVEAYVPGEHDYSALVSRMKAAGIGVIYIGGYQQEAGLIARQAADQGLKAVVIGGDALLTREFWQIAGKAGEGTLMTFAPDPRSRPAAAKVVAEFKAHGVDPEGYTLYTYAAIQIWAEAATKAGTTDPQKVARTLKAAGPWPSVLGPVSFDSKGDVEGTGYVFYVWHDGDYHMLNPG